MAKKKKKTSKKVAAKKTTTKKSTTSKTKTVAQKTTTKASTLTSKLSASITKKVATAAQLNTINIAKSVIATVEPGAKYLTASQSVQVSNSVTKANTVVANPKYEDDYYSKWGKDPVDFENEFTIQIPTIPVQSTFTVSPTPMTGGEPARILIEASTRKVDHYGITWYINEQTGYSGRLVADNTALTLYNTNQTGNDKNWEPNDISIDAAVGASFESMKMPSGGVYWMYKSLLKMDPPVTISMLTQIMISTSTDDYGNQSTQTEEIQNYRFKVLLFDENQKYIGSSRSVDWTDENVTFVEIDETSLSDADKNDPTKKNFHYIAVAIKNANETPIDSSEMADVLKYSSLKVEFGKTNTNRALDEITAVDGDKALVTGEKFIFSYPDSSSTGFVIPNTIFTKTETRPKTVFTTSTGLTLELRDVESQIEFK